MLSQVDMKNTKKAVDSKMEVYNCLALSVLNDEQFVVDEGDFTVQLNVDRDNANDEDNSKYDFVEYIISRYNRLSPKDKKIIYYAYISKDKPKDEYIASKLGYTLNYYYRIRRDAIKRFAFALNIEVYEGDENEINWEI